MSRTTFYVRWHRILKSVMLIQGGRGGGPSPKVRAFCNSGCRTLASFAYRLLAHTQQATPILPKNKRTIIRDAQIQATTNPMHHRNFWNAHRADISRDMSEKCQLVPVRISSLFEQNVLKAVGRTQIEGSSGVCVVFASCKACDIVAEDACSVASQHSIGLIDNKGGTFHAPTEQLCHLTCRGNANLFQWEFPACSNIMSRKQSAGHR